MKRALSVIIIVVILSILSVILSGCQRNNALTCPPSMITVGGECCSDANNNTICDTIEKEKVEKNTPVETSTPNLKENTTAKEIQEKVVSSINLSNLESGINKTYFPLKRYHFEDAKRVNITGIENTFDVRKSAIFNILKIKKEYNYLRKRENFSDFVKRRYDLGVKNNEIEANSWIDYQRLRDEEWTDVNHSYEHQLEALQILNKESFIEKHLLVYERKGRLLDIGIDYKITVPCTPELVVEVYPSEHWGGSYSLESPVETNQPIIKKTMDEEKPNMIKNAEKVLKICEGKPEEPQFKPSEVVFYGVDGFYPQEAHVAVGKNFTIHNENMKLKDLSIYFTFVRDEPRKVLNSKMVNHGEKIEIELPEPGNYTYFAYGYNPRAKVIVS